MIRQWLLIAVLLLSACGYKPTAIYTKNILSEKIYVDVTTSLEDPENSVLIRDAIYEAVHYRFHATIAKKEQATSQLYITLKHVYFKAIEYDKNGYAVAYKTLVTLHARYHDRADKIHELDTYGDYDFNIASNSIISDTKRFNAIKEASQKAIDAFISHISIQGVTDDHQ